MNNLQKKTSRIIRTCFPRIREFSTPNGTRYVVNCRKKGWTGKNLMEFTTKAESLMAAKEVKELYYQPQQIRKLEQLDQ